MAGYIDLFLIYMISSLAIYFLIRVNKLKVLKTDSYLAYFLDFIFNWVIAINLITSIICFTISLFTILCNI